MIQTNTIEKPQNSIFESYLLTACDHIGYEQKIQQISGLAFDFRINFADFKISQRAHSIQLTELFLC